MVNRIWLHMMGNGIVRSPEDFGATGLAPSHPELLDYLAVEFMDNGWSVKQLIREIALSRVYQVSSEFDQAKFENDPENKYCWRMEPKRLDAEVLRDSMLFASGELDPQRPRASLVAAAGTALIREGSLINLGDAAVGSMRESMESMRSLSQRERRERFENRRRAINPIDQPVNYRSVYLPIVRDNLPRSLEVFDFAEPSMVIGQRDSSNTPDQGLYFLNNEFVIQQSDAMARRLIKAHDKVKDRLEMAFLLAYGRQASSAELRATSNFYRKFQPKISARRSDDFDFQKLSAVCQAIMASAEFRFIN